MSAEASPRIHGTEMEWCIRFLPYASDHHPTPSFVSMESSAINKVVNTYLLPHIPRLGSSPTNSFLSNGSRLYMDIGEHLEYATAEDASFMGTVANELAGEQLILAAFERAKQANELRDFAINRRVVDEYGGTWGYHESYCAPVNSVQISAASLALLGVHLATRNVFFGAGYVERNGTFQLSQKATSLGTDFQNKTTNANKPVVNLRDESHAKAEDWVRVHVTSGDPNMSPWATFMKLATTSLVLRLIENGHELPWLRFKSPLFKVARLVSADTKLKEHIVLEDGRKIRPVEVQEALAVEAHTLSKEVGLPDEELLAISEWLQASEDASKDPLRLRARADWVAKQLALQRYEESHGIGWNSKEMRTKERQWDLLGPPGIGWAMRQRVWGAWMPDEELVEERMYYPPENTRAFVRGTFVRTFAGKPEANCDWVTAKADRKTLFMRQPDGSDAERIWQQIADEVRSKVKPRG